MDKELFYFTDLATRTFNLLNGVINPINHNLLLVINDDIPYTGMLYTKSMLYINIDKIINSKIYSLSGKQTQIIYVIVHELLHADQVVDQYIYKQDKEYANMKEAEVVYESCKYISNNKEYLENVLNVEIKDIILTSYIDDISKTINIQDIHYINNDIEQSIKFHIRTFIGKDFDKIDWNKRNMGLYLTVGNRVEMIPLRLDWNWLPDSPEKLQNLILEFVHFRIRSERDYWEDENNFIINIKIISTIRGISYL